MIKYRVYYQDGVVLFADERPQNYRGESLQMTSAEIISTKVLQKVQITKHLLLISSDTEALFAAFCDQLRLIEAGGGIVRNEWEETLMIYRNGRWDLPKGKLEPGEAIEQCALREVEEETGVQGLELGDFWSHSYHCYALKENIVLKRTTWYAMQCRGAQPLLPQIEEGIVRVEWIPQVDLPKFLALSFATIRDLFETENN